MLRTVYRLFGGRRDIRRTNRWLGIILFVLAVILLARVLFFVPTSSFPPPLFAKPEWSRNNQVLFSLIVLEKDLRDLADLSLKFFGAFALLIAFRQLVHSRRQNSSERLKQAGELLLKAVDDTVASELHRDVALVLLAELFQEHPNTRVAVIVLLHRYIQSLAYSPALASDESTEIGKAEKLPARLTRHPLSRTVELYFRLCANHNPQFTAPSRNLDLQRLELSHTYFEGAAFDNCDLRGGRFLGQPERSPSHLAPFK